MSYESCTVPVSDVGPVIKLYTRLRGHTYENHTQNTDKDAIFAAVLPYNITDKREI